MRYVLVTFTALLCAVTIISAQESRATLIGRVTDPSGASIAGAVVRTTNLATNSLVASTTNESGSYEVPYLLPGVYRIEVETAGFQEVGSR